MNISSLTLPISNSFTSITQALSSSVSSLSSIILATSVAALVGIGIYHWTHSSSSSSAPIDPAFAKVKSRVATAYAYVFGGLTLTAVTAALAHATGLSRLMMDYGTYCVPAALILSIGGLVTALYVNKESVKIKYLALAVFNVAMGLVVSPLAFVQRTILAQAAFITMGIGTLLTLAAFLAPNKKFLQWEGPLAAALSAISIASCVAYFFPNTAFAYGVDRVSLYGGLLIFSFYFLISTQRLLEKAEKESDAQFDPINASMNLYFDTFNIFMRILRILLENKPKEKKAMG